VEAHYRRDGLTGEILDALRAAGKDRDSLTLRDLAPLDQFHSRGREATLELASLAGIAGLRVLDVGGGIGGPARTLADELGCTVEVLDITEDYCRAGETLKAMVGLGDRVSFTVGSALEMPYPAGSFDAVWTQHSSMNVPDKAQLYREIRRVLLPGGRLALHEILAGPTSPIHLPVPWARTPEASYLVPPEAARALIAATGFEELAWIDDTAPTLEWFRKRSKAIPHKHTYPLGLHLLLGEDFPRMFRNQLHNLQEGRLRVVQGVFERRQPGSC